VFEVELERPQAFRFSAGQSIRVFAGGAGRDYSLAGGPSAGTLSLCVRLVEGGTVSPLLASAAPGTVVTFTGPHGVFTFPGSQRPVVWAATGVGIAPFRSMVRDGATGFTLLHGVRQGSELFYRKELAAAAARYVPCLSRETAPGCFSGRVTAWAAVNLAPGAYDIFLCGNRRMVRDFLVLVDERFPGSRVFTEIFF
jgi:ferredoxin-NADP reductase